MIGEMILISIGSAVIVSLFQDGAKALFKKLTFKSDCKCCKIKYNNYSSNAEIVKKNNDINKFEMEELKNNNN